MSAGLVMGAMRQEHCRKSASASARKSESIFGSSMRGLKVLQRPLRVWKDARRC